jgi:hypothetical protein
MLRRAGTRRHVGHPSKKCVGARADGLLAKRGLSEHTCVTHRPRRDNQQTPSRHPADTQQTPSRHPADTTCRQTRPPALVLSSTWQQQQQRGGAKYRTNRPVPQCPLAHERRCPCPLVKVAPVSSWLRLRPKQGSNQGQCKKACVTATARLVP